MGNFDDIMQDITSGLTNNPDCDIPYLMQRVEEYRDNELFREIARACGRIMWEILPEEKRANIAKTIDEHSMDTDAAIQQALANLKEGKPEKALGFIASAARKLDDLAANGWCADDSESVYFNFESAADEIVWRVHSEETREARCAVEPFCMVYYLYGSCLYEMGKHAEAIKQLEKAVKWNPSMALSYFEIGENYKKLGDLESFNEWADRAYSYIRTPSMMAQYHRAKGYYFTEIGSYKIAAAHQVVSMLFEQGDMAASELAYLKTRCGQDFTEMGFDEAVACLEEEGENVLPDRETLRALLALIRIAIDHNDTETVLKVSRDYCALTGDEEIEQLADRIEREIAGN